MQIGIFGTGMVGQTLGSKLVALGHDVKLGSRSATNEKGAQWVSERGPRATHGTFADAAAFGEIVFNCTSGEGALDAVRAAGASNLEGKVLVDVSNPLDYSTGRPPTLFVCNTDSLAERVQAAMPGARVVKALNTMNADVMVNPSMIPGPHDVLICGNDGAAKQRVTEVLQSFGWTGIIDLGDLTAARGMEMVLPLWLRLSGTFKTPHFNFHFARG